MPAMEAAITPSDPLKDVKSLEEIQSLSPDTEPAKDSKKGSKGKNMMDQQSTKSGSTSDTPRITIKLVAKKKVKTLKEPNKKSVKKLKIKGIQDQLTAKDIQGDQISSAHVKLKTEPQEDKHGTEDKGGGNEPARRRGRSAAKMEPICQASAKVVVDDQKSKEKKSASRVDTVPESSTVAPKTCRKKLKRKQISAEQGSEAGQTGTRRSNRVTNPPNPPESKNSSAPAESNSEVSKTVEAKPSVRSDGRRQSKRLNKNAASSDKRGPSSEAQSSDGVQVKNEESRVPSLKLKKIRNPKYDPQASGKNPAQKERRKKKKKRRKYIWILTSEDGEIPTQGAENTVKVTEKTVSEVGQSVAVCDTTVTKGLKGTDKRSKMDNAASQGSTSSDSNEKDSQNKADLSPEEKSASAAEVDVEPVNETPSQEANKTDCGKVVPPLQIKKVSSPGKHKSSKPSFLIQQVSPVPEKKEEPPTDLGEVPEDKPACPETEVTPTRRLRRRTPSVDSLQTNSLCPKPVTLKRRPRAAPQDEGTSQEQEEQSSQAPAEDPSLHSVPKTSCEILAEDPPQVVSAVPSEVPVEKDSSKIDGDSSQVPVEVSPQKMENEAEPQIEEAKQLSVPSKPRKCRNNKFGKKRTVKKKKAVVPPEIPVSAESATVEAPTPESVLKEDTQVLETEVPQSEPQECSQPEAKQDTLPVEEEEEQIPVQEPLPVKEETDIQQIDSQPTIESDCQTSELQTSTQCLQDKSLTSKKKRKNFTGHRPKHKHRGKDGKFAPLSVSERLAEVDSDMSAPSETTTTLSSGPKLVGVQKKYKKKPTGLRLFGSERPKPQAKVISNLLEMGLQKDSLKQEETGSLVDGRQPDVGDAQPTKSKFVKNIKHFIMPVVSARSSRVIKTPQRFMDDVGMSVLPRRNSPKKGLQLGLQVRPAKKRDDGACTPISPILPLDDEDIFSEAQLDVDLFSAQDLEDSIDITDSLFSEKKSGKNEKKKNSCFKWHLPDDSSEDVYTLDKTPESKCENLFFPTPVNKPAEIATDPLDAQKKKSTLKFNKQMAHLKIYQRLKKVHTGLPKSKFTTETDGVSKPPQPPIDLAEGLDDEAMSISLRQRDTSTEKEKSKLKIEDLDSPGVVRKVCVRVRTPTSKSYGLQRGEEEGLAFRGTARLHSGEQNSGNNHSLIFPLY